MNSEIESVVEAAVERAMAIHVATMNDHMDTIRYLQDRVRALTVQVVELKRGQSTPAPAPVFSATEKKLHIEKLHEAIVNHLIAKPTVRATLTRDEILKLPGIPSGLSPRSVVGALWKWRVKPAGFDVKYTPRGAKKSGTWTLTLAFKSK